MRLLSLTQKVLALGRVTAERSLPPLYGHKDEFCQEDSLLCHGPNVAFLYRQRTSPRSSGTLGATRLSSLPTTRMRRENQVVDARAPRSSPANCGRRGAVVVAAITILAQRIETRFD
jgi:hypothetical protein